MKRKGAPPRHRTGHRRSEPQPSARQPAARGGAAARAGVSHGAQGALRPREDSRRERRAQSARGEAPRGRPDTSNLLMGRNALRETIRRVPHRLERVYIAYLGEGASERQELLLAAQGAGIAVEQVPLERLTQMVGSDSHQGVVARLFPAPSRELRVFLQERAAAERSLLVMLDSIHDPQNLGTILRAAECFAADGVMLSSNRGTPITATVRKASVGASELVEVVTVANLAQACERLKDAGYWIVVADNAPGALSLNEFSFPQRAVLVLGSEGEGVHQLLRARADFAVKIPLFGDIDSLNVSQAAAVLLNHYRAHMPL